MDTGRTSTTRREADPATQSDPDVAASIAVAHAGILVRISDAARRVGRQPDQIRLVGVSKTVPADRLRAAAAAGVTTFGENRVQEAEDKIPLVPGVDWHLVGPLQSNKARRAVAIFGTIETVSSVDLAERLDRIVGEMRPEAPLRVLLQVNVDGDPAKTGFAAGTLADALPSILALPNLRVDGLMTVGRLASDPAAARATFAGLRGISEDLRRAHATLGADLSMGMSDDFEIATEEGATIVRVGRALFGARAVDAV